MTEDQRDGVVSDVPGGVRLRFRRSWPDPIEDVWAALTENERLVRWIGTYDGPRGAGATGSFTMTHEAEPASEAVTIVECEPPRRLVLEWTAQEHWRIELDLAVQDGRTVLLFTQVLATAEGVEDVAAGWHWYLDKLDAVVTGGPPPADWDAFLAEYGPVHRRPPSP